LEESGVVVGIVEKAVLGLDFDRLRAFGLEIPARAAASGRRTPAACASIQTLSA